MQATTTDELTVAVIGLGYIGLPTAAVLAQAGVDVIGVDVNTATVEAVNGGRVPFVEPDLEMAVAGAVSTGRLRAQTTIPDANAFIIAVPTPFRPDHTADLSYIDAATDALIPHLTDGSLVVLESTAPPGTTRYVADRILAARPDLALEAPAALPSSNGTATGIIHVAHCPERVLPGRVMVEMVTNDRVVGGLTPAATTAARELYERFCKGEVVPTDAITAELAKLVENSYRDVNIAYANEIASVAEKFDVDAWELIGLANRHPRVNILNPGPGVGGHCIAVDPWFIVAAAPERTRLVRLAREVNDARPSQVVERVLNRANRLRDPRIAALGLAFKADIDDLRESPARQIVAELANALPEARIDVVEPHVTELPPELRSRENINLRGLEEAVADADIVLVLVDHTAFRRADPKALHLTERVVIDTRGLWR